VFDFAQFFHLWTGWIDLADSCKFALLTIVLAVGAYYMLMPVDWHCWLLLWLLLADSEQQQQQQQQQPGASGVQALKQNVAQTAAAAGKGRQKPKLPGFPGGAAGAAAAAAALAAAKQQRQQGMYNDEYEDEEEATPEFQLTFDNGKAVSKAGYCIAGGWLTRLSYVHPVCMPLCLPTWLAAGSSVWCCAWCLVFADALLHHVTGL
jgi:hypothetical protein